MTDIVALYHDAALMVPVSASAPITAQQYGSTPAPIQLQVWLGALTGVTLQAESAPGVDQITLSVSDTDVGTGQPVTAIKLALTQAGLATATAGAALDVGLELVGGPAWAIPIWIELDDQTGAHGTYTDLSLITNTLIEV